MIKLLALLLMVFVIGVLVYVMWFGIVVEIRYEIPSLKRIFVKEWLNV